MHGGEAWKSPEEVIELRGLDVISMVAGRSHCLALLSAGDVYSWGAASAGEEAADVLEYYSMCKGDLVKVGNCIVHGGDEVQGLEVFS